MGYGSVYYRFYVSHFDLYSHEGSLFKQYGLGVKTFVF